ncbi:hypothetical protein A0J61_10039 [Choanephora cucurbitarum]|uniref:Uncharacterized protein n=1 Tax=Choanephora cucurbitarum TaxID=101091 RepID=A0A1C7MYN7_9FUNG|nr:hypothetical protein A0J61_10039 [Choanephora cucurbitarum]
MKTIQTSLPYLQSLNIWIASSVLESSTLSFYRSFRYIASLSLREQANEKSLLDILSHHTQLKELSVLASNKMNITSRLLASVHQQCPYLEFLAMEGAHAKAPEHTTQLTYPTIHHIKVLKLQLCSGMDACHQWLAYIGTAYPQLESLALKSHKKDASQENESHPVEIYRQFWTNCPKLVDVDLCGIEIGPLFFQQLEQQQRPLKRLGLCGICSDCLVICNGLFDSSNLSTIQSMNLALPFTRTSNRFIESIGKACPRLQHLALNGYYFLTGDIAMATLLNALPCLISLEVVQANLCALDNQARHSVLLHPLKKMKFVQCMLLNEVFDYVAARCYSLQYLTLNDNRFDAPCLPHSAADEVQPTISCYKTEIHLPNQQLREFKIGRRIRTKKAPFDQIVQLFHVKQNQKKQEHWYHIDTHRENPSSVPVIARPFQEIEDKINKPHTLQQGYISLVCQSIDAVYMNKKRLVIGSIG